MIRDKGSRVITLLPTASVERASQVLRDARIGAIPVVDKNGWMAGIVLEGAIVRGVAGRGAGVLADPVSALVTREVRTCTPDSSIDQFMEQILDGRIRHLPFADLSSFIGIDSVGDVVKQGHAGVLAVRDTLHRYIREASVQAIDYD